MNQYVWLDILMEEASVCVLGRAGKVTFEGVVATQTVFADTWISASTGITTSL
jgi:hypothetical protein